MYSLGFLDYFAVCRLKRLRFNDLRLRVMGLRLGYMLKGEGLRARVKSLSLKV